MPERGNPAALRAAAQRKHHEAVERAEQALRALIRTGEPINFRAVARLADCSPDFLYRTPALRARIEQHRSQPLRAAASANPGPAADSPSAVVRELAAQLADEKRRRRDEVAELETALAAAHGELLELRRRFAAHSPRATWPSARVQVARGKVASTNRRQPASNQGVQAARAFPAGPRSRWECMSSVNLP
jgi:hypothetical protein